MTANQLVQHFSAGDRIGEYQLVRRIRSGARATLFLARRSGVFGFSRVAVIKVIHPHLLQDDRLVRMVIDEARILSRIAHPNVVHVEEFRENDGLLYLVMEYVAGCSASQLINMLREQQEKLPVALAVHIAMKTAEGLHAAHETIDDEGRPLGIVHRDVSPPNILISTEGGVKLIDFGIAKAYAVAQDTGTDLSLKGKVRYMSPEQARGEPINRRADIYSLGLVLWELLTGEPAFEADTDQALLEMVRAPQLRSLNDFRRDVPPGLGEVIQRMTAVEPKDRPPDAYATARTLAAAVPPALFVDPRQLGAYVRRRNAWASRAHGKHGRDSLRPGATPTPSPIRQGHWEPARTTSGELQPFLLEPEHSQPSSADQPSGSGTDSLIWRKQLPQEDALVPPPPELPPTLLRMVWTRTLWTRASAWTTNHRNVSVAAGLTLVGLVGFVVALASMPKRSAERPSIGALPVESRPPEADNGKSRAASAPASPGATRPTTSEGAPGNEESRTEATRSALSVVPLDADRMAPHADDLRGSEPSRIAEAVQDVLEDQDASASFDHPADKSTTSIRRTRRSSQRDRHKTVSARRETLDASESRPSEAKLSESGSAQDRADDDIIRIDGVSLAKDADIAASPDKDDRNQHRRKAPIRVGKTPIAEGFEEK